MSIEDLRKDAIKEWDEYRKAIIELFGFPKDSRLLPIEPMTTILETYDEDCIREKIQLIQTLAQTVKNSRNI